MKVGLQEDGVVVGSDSESPIDLTVGVRCSKGLIPYKFPTPDPSTSPEGALVFMGYMPTWGDVVRMQV